VDSIEACRTALTLSELGDSERGVSLVETLLAALLMAAALVALAELVALSVRNGVSARAESFAIVLAQQKMEQLRGLTWSFDTAGLPVSDTTTDTALAVESPAGGTGLSLSPPDVLEKNTTGYVDYLDQMGNSLGGGPTLPSGTAYIRRWSIEPLPSDPGNTLFLRILVTRRVDRGSSLGFRDEARLMSIRTRKSR
jgi:hypothetical protein